MSQESYEWLRTQVLAGFKDSRPPWWSEGGTLGNLFSGAVPLERVRDLMTSWEPIHEPLYSGDMEEITTHKLVRASDTREVMSVIGASTPRHTYRDWIVESVPECIGDDAQISSAGLLRARTQAWVQIERPEVSHAAGGVTFAPYVLLSMSIDNSIATQINQSVTHTICDNTMSLGRSQGVSFRKTKNSGGRLGDYRSVLTALNQGETDFKAMVDELLAKRVDDRQFGRFVENLIPVNEDDATAGGNAQATYSRKLRQRQDITQLYKHDARVAGWEGTAWGVVQAVNTYNQHMSRLVNKTGHLIDDRNLRAIKVMEAKIKGTVDDTATLKVLEAVTT